MFVRGTDLEHQAQTTIEAALLGQLTVPIFAEWVYTHPDLAQVFGYAFEEDLLTFDYHAQRARTPLLHLLRHVYQEVWPDTHSRIILWRSEVLETAYRILQHEGLFPTTVVAMAELSLNQDDTLFPSDLFTPFWDFYSDYDYLCALTYENGVLIDCTEANVFEQIEAHYRPIIEHTCQQLLCMVS